MAGKFGFAALCAVFVVVLTWTAGLVLGGGETSGKAGGHVTAQPSPSGRGSSVERDRPTESSPRPAASTARPNGAVEVVVLRLTDGDTLHVSTEESTSHWQAGVDTTVRLLEMDTPESVDPNRPVECFSEEATGRLGELLPNGSDAFALLDRDALDPYGRTLAYLWNDDGVFVNLAMVEEGFATAVLYEPNDRYIDEMRAAEMRARRAGRGMWSSC